MDCLRRRWSVVVDRFETCTRWKLRHSTGCTGSHRIGDVDLGGAATALSADNLHSCALMETGMVRCWGFGTHGQLGYGDAQSIGDNEVPADAGDVPVF